MKRKAQQEKPDGREKSCELKKNNLDYENGDGILREDCTNIFTKYAYFLGLML